MDTSVRLRVATRVHFALLRHYGEDVGVGALLRGGSAAREALWVCEASDVDELAALGRELGGLLNAEATARAQADAPQDAPWARDTSGFGVTRPGDEAPAPATARRRWFSAVRWR